VLPLTGFEEPMVQEYEAEELLEDDVLEEEDPGSSSPGYSSSPVVDPVVAPGLTGIGDFPVESTFFEHAAKKVINIKDEINGIL
jgi:hypothetical protein